MGTLTLLVCEGETESWRPCCSSPQAPWLHVPHAHHGLQAQGEHRWPVPVASQALHQPCLPDLMLSGVSQHLGIHALRAVAFCCSAAVVRRPPTWGPWDHRPFSALGHSALCFLEQGHGKHTDPNFIAVSVPQGGRGVHSLGSWAAGDCLPRRRFCFVSSWSTVTAFPPWLGL